MYEANDLISLMALMVECQTPRSYSAAMFDETYHKLFEMTQVLQAKNNLEIILFWCSQIGQRAFWYET